MKAIAIAALLIFAHVQDTSYSLVWKPKVDQKITYAFAIEGTLNQSEFKVTSDVSLHVKKVEANGDYTLGTSFKNMTAKFFGEEQKVPDDPEEVQKFNARGDLLDEKKPSEDGEPDVIGEILSRAGEFEAPTNPVKVGDKWTHTFAPDKVNDLPKATGSYTLLSESAGKLKISIEYHEESGVDPTSAKGVAVIDASDFTLISVESEIRNLRFQEGVPPGSAKLKMTKK